MSCTIRFMDRNSFENQSMGRKHKALKAGTTEGARNLENLETVKIVERCHQ